VNALRPCGHGRNRRRSALSKGREKGLLAKKAAKKACWLLRIVGRGTHRKEEEEKVKRVGGWKADEKRAKRTSYGSDFLILFD
jgi:hypothetical protein